MSTDIDFLKWRQSPDGWESIHSAYLNALASRPREGEADNAHMAAFLKWVAMEGWDWRGESDHAIYLPHDHIRKEPPCP